MPWYTHEALRRGSFAAFLGLQVDVTRGVWHAIALGDTCLFIIRKSRIWRSFPLDSPSAFKAHPHLLPSSLTAPDSELSLQRSAWGQLAIGDLIIVVTDALAAWTLSARLLRPRPWCLLLAAREAGEFTTLLDGLRARGELRDDDAAVYIAEVCEA